MKILMILIRWPWGVGEVVRSISKEFKKLGHEVDVIAREEDLKKYSLISSIFPIRRKINELMKEKKYDIIYTHDWSTTFPLLFPYRIFKKKHFCIFYGNQIGHTKIFQNLVGKIMRKNLFVVGDLNKKKFPHSTLVRNAVDMEKFKPLKKKRIYLGWPEKGTEAITREEVLEIGKKLNMPVLIAKNLPSEKMNEFYNQCKVFLSFPPRASAGALSWMEAMSAGVPIIIGNYESESYLFPIEKSKNVKDIENIIRNAKEKNNRKWLEEHDFKWENHVHKLIEVFQNN